MPMSLTIARTATKRMLTRRTAAARTVEYDAKQWRASRKRRKQAEAASFGGDEGRRSCGTPGSTWRTQKRRAVARDEFGVGGAVIVATAAPTANADQKHAADGADHVPIGA